MTMQPAFWPGEAACAGLARIRSACDDAACLMQAAAAETRWESPAAGEFSCRLWERVAEVAAVGDLAMQLSYAARAEQGAVS